MADRTYNNSSVFSNQLKQFYATRAGLIILRTLIGIIGIVLFNLSHTPYCMPVYFFQLVPWVILWRSRMAPRSIWQVILESCILGYIMVWLTTQFFPQADNSLIRAHALHSLCCLIFSSQVVALAITIWTTSSWRITRAAPMIAFVAMFSEVAHGLAVGITWITSNSVLSVAASPVAQWCELLTPFGVSTALFWIGCLWLPDSGQLGVSRWLSTVTAVVGAAVLWLGGVLIEKSISVQSLSFTVVAIQPHRYSNSEVRTWRILDRLTRESLRTQGRADLILWPESALDSSYYADFSKYPNVPTPGANIEDSMPISRFCHELLPLYQTNCLVGSTNRDSVRIRIDDDFYLLDSAFNCGCVLSPKETVDCHEKLALVPDREAGVTWLNKFSKYFSWHALGSVSESTYQPGRNFHPLTFTDRSGVTRKIAVAICYESWLPWLPQYHCDEPLDAICHLAYDGDFKEHPEYTQRMLLTIRLRAIETRTWQLVCSHYAGTAVIDPRGRIVKQLPPGPGVLRTDQLK